MNAIKWALEFGIAVGVNFGAATNAIRQIQESKRRRII